MVYKLIDASGQNKKWKMSFMTGAKCLPFLVLYAVDNASKTHWLKNFSKFEDQILASVLKYEIYSLQRFKKIVARIPILIVRKKKAYTKV